MEMLSKKPIIGILCDIDKETKEDRPFYFVKSNYVSAIKEAGGIPFLIPPIKNKNDRLKLLNNVNGMLFPGGDDIDPKYFNEKPHPSLILTDSEILQFQMDICRFALKNNLPVLGICAGLQLINITFGGNIYQDIPAQCSNPLKHKKTENEKKDAFHFVIIEKGTMLYNIFHKAKIKVNSTHHQVIKDIAHGFTVSARSSDGLIEAIESKRHYFVIGVQWHPEDIYKNNALFLNLFKKLVDAARQNANK